MTLRQDKVDADHIPCVIIAYGLDSYNQDANEETANPLRSHGGGDTTAKVIISYEQDPNRETVL